MDEKHYVTGKQVKDMLLGAYHSFEKNFQLINDLNVFPVPDGDTGSNMMHTMASVARAISGLSNDATAGEVGTAAARSAIMGARGNSGVILSQLLRGIGKGLAGKVTLNNTEIGKAFQFGILYAYRSVSQPVEGTILSVARGMAKGAYNAVRSSENLELVLREAIRVGKEELADTPNKLAALKEAGVVDAGGQGLIVFFEGCLAGLRGYDCQVLPIAAKPQVGNLSQPEPLDLEYPYCTEFIVKGAHVDKKTVSEALQGFGNSMIVAVVEDIVKVHIHTKHPGLALNKAQEWGSLHDIKVENMKDQHENRLFGKEETAQASSKREAGVLTVAAGDGIAKMMHELGAAAIVNGGQSMNPPVEAFVQAIVDGDCERYIILPNNKNIILAAEQVRKLMGTTKVAYVPTTNLAQGLTALLHFDATRTFEENIVIMAQEAKTATGAAITVAVRDSVVRGLVVKKGDYLGLLNDHIVCKGTTLTEVLEKLLADGDYELVSLYYGSEVSETEAQKLLANVQALNPDWEVELFYGGQPLYPLLLALE